MLVRISTGKGDVGWRTSSAVAPVLGDRVETVRLSMEVGCPARSSVVSSEVIVGFVCGKASTYTPVCISSSGEKRSGL